MDYNHDKPELIGNFKTFMQEKINKIYDDYKEYIKYKNNNFEIFGNYMKGVKDDVSDGLERKQVEFLKDTFDENNDFDIEEEIHNALKDLRKFSNKLIDHEPYKYKYCN